jgi:oligopeptide/dipeptide ABC transporter ATP-binding protein
MQPILIRGEAIMVLDNNNDLLLEVKDLRVSFPMDEGVVQAVDGANLSIEHGKVLGLAGESGCGKTVTAQSIMRIVPRPGRVDAGQILFHRSQGSSNNGVIDLAQLNPGGRRIRQIRGKEITMIFQEPMSSFSPVYTIGDQIVEAILLHQRVDKREARAIGIELLDRVGIPNAARRIDDYPFEFSGGMRQRAMIAAALSCNPSLLIADEPTTALDVTIQAQILELMKYLQQEIGMAIMFITHNLGVIAQIANKVAIMYLGKVVEEGPVREIFHNPNHPYTVNLLQAIPRIGKTSGQRLFSIRGGVPGPFERVRGCAFHPRCDEMIPGRCDMDVPTVTQLGNGHSVRCFLYQ